MFATANAVCNGFVAVLAESDQIGKGLLSQWLGIVVIWWSAIFVVNLQVFTTAASLTAVIISVKPS